MVSAPARRIAAFYAIERGIPQRRACALMQVARSSLKYVPTLPQQHAPIAQAMQRLSGQYPRYGARRIRVFLAREGIEVGKEKCSKLWAEQGLQVPKKRPRRKVAASRPRPLAPATANSVWSYDFVLDACANGQQIKCLTVVDEYTREALAIDVAGSIRSSRVIDVLAKLISMRGAPRYLRSDNGPEFVSVALLKWVSEQGIECALIDPGKPWQNGTTESFNGKFRDECLAMEWFRNRLEAKIVIEDWRQHYNQVRPHSSLNYETPEAFSKKAAMTLSTGAIPS
jgi:putative transposase